MSEDRTRDLPDARSFEERVLAEFAAQRDFNAQLLGKVEQLSGRLTALEDKVDRRLMETRPIWEAMQAQLNGLEAKTDGIQAQLTSVESKVDDMQEQLLHIDSKVASIDVQMGELAVELLAMRGDNRGMQKRMVRLEKLQPQS